MKTFKEQFDRLTSEYIAGNIYPYNGCACFVGNLLNGHDDWTACRVSEDGIRIMTFESSNFSFVYGNARVGKELIKKNGYSIHEIVRLEQTFLETLQEECPVESTYVFNEIFTPRDTKHPNYEPALFHAFEKTLDVLKEIHESKGEVVEPFAFVMRETVK